MYKQTDRIRTDYLEANGSDDERTDRNRPDKNPNKSVQTNSTIPDCGGNNLQPVADGTPPLLTPISSHVARFIVCQTTSAIVACLMNPNLHYPRRLDAVDLAPACTRTNGLVLVDSDTVD
jgi:hypothetical protein